MIHKRALMRFNGRHADRIHIINRGMQADSFNNGGRTRFKPRRGLGPGRFFEAHAFDHIATAQEGRHAIQMFQLAPQHANARWPVKLMAGEAVEIAANGSNIHAPMHHGLRPIQQNLRTMRMGQRHHTFNRRDGTQHIGHMRERDQPHLAIGKLGGQVFHVQFAGIRHTTDAQGIAAFITQHLPGHDIGMVFKLGNQHRLIRAHHAAAPAMRDQIDRFRAVARENHFPRIRRIDEARDRTARSLKSIGRHFGKPIGAAMDIGISRFHAARHGINHRAGLLRTRPRIKKHERLAVLRLGQDREILPDALDIKTHDAVPCRTHQPSTAAVSASRNTSSSSPSKASCKKACTSMDRA